jgi:ATP-binding cassette subfamily B protein
MNSANSAAFFKLLSAILKHQKPLYLGGFMIVLGTTTTLLEPRILGLAIDEGIIPKNLDRLHTIGFLFVSVTILRVVSMILQTYFFEVLGQRVTQDLRVLLFSHLQRMPVSIYDKISVGQLLTRVTNDIAALSEMFSAGFVSMVSNFLLVVGILTWLMVLDLRLGLISAGVFPFLVWASVYFSKQLSIAYREARAKLSAVNSFLAENLSGIKTIFLFNRQKLHCDQFEKLNESYAKAQISSTRIFALFQPAITLASGVSVGLIIWYGGKETLDGGVKLGILVTYFSYILSLFQPLREIADKWNIFLSGMASAERIYSVFNWAVEETAEMVEQEVSGIESLRGHIVFENVWFAYEEENWVLRDFSLEIRPGERIGVVGHTGAGKTTLISLLMRFYEPQRGRILLDGKDLRDYEKRPLRASIGIVQQEVFLFSGSFHENINFGKNHELHQLKEVLNDIGFQKSMNEEVQERGVNFSMGERQMIAFARAMMTRPSIWILDEATANLDSETESVIQRALEKASYQKTSLLIAHRLATVRSADRILVLNKGVLVEQGRHEDLLKQNGLYARLLRYQQIQEPSREQNEEARPQSLAPGSTQSLVSADSSNGSQVVSPISGSSA